MILYNDSVGVWVAEKLGIRDFGPFRAIGIIVANELVAGAVYHNYRHPNIELSFASTSPRWATRSNFRGILAYPFIQLRCKRITAVTEATNQPARAFLCRFGWKEEGYHPQLFKNGDGVSYGLTRDSCRWLAEESHGKIRSDASSTG